MLFGNELIVTDDNNGNVTIESDRLHINNDDSGNINISSTISPITTTNISLDFYNNKIVVVNAKQADSKSRYISVACTEYGRLFKLDKNTMSIFIRCQKPDGFYVFNNAQITDDGKALIELTQQMLAVDGKCRVDLTILQFTCSHIENSDTTEITSSNDVSILSTMTFFVNIIDYPIDSSTVVSSNEFDAMMKGVADMVITQKEAREATANITELHKIIETNETERNSREISRIDNENIRTSNETDRIRSENERKSNETERVNAEIERNNKFNTSISECDNATYFATTAANNANNAAERCDGIIDKTGVVLQEEKGIANGVASLNSNGVIPYYQLSVATGFNISQSGAWLLDASAGFKLNSFYYTLSESIAKLTNSICLVESNDIEAGYSGDVIIPFPDGFNEDNTVVLNIESLMALNGTLDNYKWTNKNAITYQIASDVGGILIPDFNTDFITKIRLVLKKI